MQKMAEHIYTGLVRLFLTSDVDKLVMFEQKCMVILV